MSIKIKLFAAIKAAAEVLVGLSAGAAASAGVFALITVIGIGKFYNERERTKS